MSAKVRKEGTSLESVSQDTGELLDEVRIETDDVRSKANAVFGSKVPLWLKIAIPIALIAIFVVSFSVGRFPISPGELVKTLSNGIAHHVGALFGNDIPIADERMYTVVFKIRLPRVLVVILTGAALAVSGASYQGMFKNPLVSPDLLGASAGASVGACLGLLLNMPTIVIQLWAFVGGLTAVGMAVWLNKFVKYDATLGLVLGGILVSTLFQSGMSLIKFMADGDDKLPSITFWLMGSFSSINSRDFWLILLPMAVGFALLLLECWKLNVLSFGDEEARSMGINTARTRLIVIFASTLLTSVTVAVAGIVGWIGLVIPHLARALVGPNYRVLLPTSMFVGSGFLLIVDDIARLLTTVEIPIGILTAILGVPFFVFIFKRNMKGWS